LINMGKSNATAAHQELLSGKHSGGDLAMFKACKLTDELGAKVGITLWIYVQMALAVANLIFAPYFQCRLWSKLTEASQDPANLEQVVARPGYEGPLAVNQQAVKASFVHVFLHDVGVCFYVFALIFSYWWSSQGKVWAHSDEIHCNPQGWISRAASFGIFFAWFTLLYAIGWYCYMNCMATGEGLVLRSGVPLAAMQSQYQSPAAASSSAVADSSPAMAVPLQQGAMVSSGGPEAVQTVPEPVDPGCFTRMCRPRQLLKLVACIGLDFMGDATYLMPAVGEVGDAAWAPAQAVMLKMMFNANGIAILGFIEEILPFSDAVPTATIAWCLETFCPYHPLARLIGIQPS